MPTLLSQRSTKAKRKAPASGRIVRHVAPHSPFQKLVDGRRAEKRLTSRALAREMSTSIYTSQSTLYTWLHSENGFPHPKAFKTAHLKALVRVLNIPEKDLLAALDASRRLYTAQEDPMPLKSKDAMRTLIDILSNEKRTTFTVSYVLNLARNLYRGATGESA
jgi:hypothetical protein